jgi:hypothetical protein
MFIVDRQMGAIQMGENLFYGTKVIFGFGAALRSHMVTRR